MLPFVSRATHDRELAALAKLMENAERRAELAEAESSEAKRLHELERRRYDALLTQFLALKVKGAEVVPVAGGLVEPQPAPAPDPHAYLKAMIAEKAGRNYAVRGAMLRQLDVDLAANVPLEDIEASILHGVPSDGVPA